MYDTTSKSATHCLQVIFSMFRSLYLSLSSAPFEQISSRPPPLSISLFFPLPLSFPLTSSLSIYTYIYLLWLITHLAPATRKSVNCIRTSWAVSYRWEISFNSGVSVQNKIRDLILAISSNRGIAAPDDIKESLKIFTGPRLTLSLIAAPIAW